MFHLSASTEVARPGMTIHERLHMLRALGLETIPMMYSDAWSATLNMECTFDEDLRISSMWRVGV